MKTLGPGSLSSLLESILTFFWVVLWFVAAAFVVLAFVDLDDSSFYFTAYLSSGPSGEAVGPGGTWKLETVAVLVSTPHDKAWIASLVAVPFLALLAFVVGELRAIFRSLREGSPFVPANARRLRRTGLGILVFEALHFVVTLTVLSPTFESLRPVAEGGLIRANTSPNFVTLFLGCAVLVLAEVFRRGTLMQDEQELTV